MRVTSKGQVTIPKDVRDRLGIGPGSEVEFSLRDKGAMLLAKQPEPDQRSREVGDFMAHIRRHKGSMNLGGLSGDEFFKLLRD